MAETKLSVTLTGDNSQLQQALDKSTEEIQDFGQEIMKLAVGFGTVAGAANMVAEKIVEFGHKAMEAFPAAIEAVNAQARSFEGLRMETGETLANLNIYDATMKMTGGTVEELGDWLKGLTRSMRSNSEVFIANGIAADNNALMQMKPIEVMRQSLAIIESCTDQNKKLILAQEMLGRSGLAALPQMHRFFETLDEGKEAFGRLGLAIDDGYLARMREMEKKTGETKIVIDALQRDVASQGVSWTNIAQNLAKGWYEACDALAKYGGLETALLAVTGVGEKGKPPQGQVNTSAHDADHSPAAGIKTKEQIDAENKAKKDAQADRDRAAAEGVRTYNSLIDQTTALDREDLAIKSATTLEGVKQQADAVALNRLKDENRKIDDTVGKSKDKDVLAQANQAKMSALILYDDQVKQNQAKFIADTKAADDAAAATALAEKQKINEVETAGLIAHQKALLGIELESLNEKRATRKISDDEYIAEATAASDKVYQIELKAINEEIAAYTGLESGLDVILNKLTALQDAHERTDAAIRKKGDSDWQKEMKQIHEQVEDETARSLTNIITQHQKAGEALKSAWASVSSSVINDVIKMEIQQLLTDQVTTASSETSMAAKIYAWYAALGPWAIPAAAATIAGVIAAISAIGGREAGGPVEAGTPYIVGEAGHELFVPTEPGMIIPHDLTSSMQAVYGSINASSARSASYNAASYMPSPSQRVEHPGGGGGQTINVHGHIIGEGVQSARVMGQITRRSTDEYNRRRG